MTTLSQALLITAIGMGLVFVAILLLWGLMELLVAVTKDKTVTEEDEPIVEIVEETPVVPILVDTASHKAQAAAVAVSAALGLAQTRPNAGKAALAAVAAALALARPKVDAPSSELPAGMPSPWQGAARTRQMAANSQISRRR